MARASRRRSPGRWPHLLLPTPSGDGRMTFSASEQQDPQANGPPRSVENATRPARNTSLGGIQAAELHLIPSSRHLVSPAEAPGRCPIPIPACTIRRRSSSTMCPTNDEKVGIQRSPAHLVARMLTIVTSQQRVCRSDVEHLRIAGTHISIAPGCKRRMWQHVIRFQLSPATAAFKQWDRIAREIHLVRPDGSSWGAGWDLTVHRKIQAALARCASEAKRLGLLRETDGERVWQDWTRGFLSVEWDGSCFDADYARALLQKASDAEDDERRQRRRYEDEIAALAAQVRDMGQLPVVPPRRDEDVGDRGAGGRQRPVPAAAPADEPARRDRNMAQNESDEDEIVPGDSVSRLVVSGDAQSLPSLPPVPRRPRPRPWAASAPPEAGNALAPGLAFGGRQDDEAPPADVAPPAPDVARFWADRSLAELEGWLRQGWARLFDLRVHMLEAFFPLAFGRGCGRQPDRRRVVAIREAREKLLEEIFFLEDMVDDRRRPFGAGPLPYPGRGLLWKYFLGGDRPSPAMEARVLGARGPYP